MSLNCLRNGTRVMKNRNHESGGGIGFIGLLTIVFITLKLTGVINWSWWWVLSPIWISFIGLLLLIAIIVTYTELTKK